ncbi:MAG: phosphoribosylamine--glycine ligase [Anaerolineales bacterium]|nr:phosphoribosylamine--glycine ligase [Anaerolineales bacterium]
MKILLIGSGGREHALARQLITSKRVDQLFVAPGNGGTARMAKTTNVDIPVSDLDALVDFARRETVDLTMVGPEAPLVDGVVDLLQAAGLRVYGPTKAAAQLEGSKAFSKQFMLRHQIPTGRAEIFDEFDAAMRYLRQLDTVPVIKASGLAAGKGVIVPDTREGAAVAVGRMLETGQFGAAGATILIEERLTGPEVSILAFCDGRTFRVMPSAQDHKRLMDGDRGPNTGGMGAFTPSALVTPELETLIERTILAPTLAGMATEGMPYFGVLYAGLMLTPDGPKVLEFNCRLGDPETQVLIPLLENDLVDVLEAGVEGRLDQLQLRWRKQAAVTVVMAAAGYPEEYATGHEITGVADAEESGAFVYQAGTKWKEPRLLTAGGRVLSVTALGRTVEQAAYRAYAGVKKVKFNGATYRRDIGLPYVPARPQKPRRSHR